MHLEAERKLDCKISLGLGAVQRRLEALGIPGSGIGHHSRGCVGERRPVVAGPVNEARAVLHAPALEDETGTEQDSQNRESIMVS